MASWSLTTFPSHQYVDWTVGIIVAQLGLSLGVLSNSLYGVVVFMAVATTLIAPPFLRILFHGEEALPHSTEEGVVDRQLSELE